VLRDIVFPELRVSKAAIADAMKISRNQLYLILGEKQRVTPDTAVRLAAAVGGSPVCGSTCRAPSTYGMLRDDVSNIPSLAEPNERPYSRRSLGVE